MGMEKLDEVQKQESLERRLNIAREQVKVELGRVLSGKRLNVELPFGDVQPFKWSEPNEPFPKTFIRFTGNNEGTARNSNFNGSDVFLFTLEDYELLKHNSSIRNPPPDLAAWVRTEFVSGYSEIKPFVRQIVENIEDVDVRTALIKEFNLDNKK